jgi:hypothetical protein
MHFATPVESSAAAAAAGTATTVAAPSVYAPPSTATAPPAYPTPSLAPSAPAASPTYLAPGPMPGPVSAAPPAAPAGSIYAPPLAPTAVPAPPTGVATQPPAPGWDPYAPPGNTPAPLLSQDPCLPASPAISMGAVQKLVQHINLNYDWFAGNPTATEKELGINDVDLNVTFAFPLFHNVERPLLVTPGFAVHYWNGPVSVLPATPSDPPPADLPPQTFDAYLDFGWNPWLSENGTVSAELNFRTGVYSDFSRVTSDSIRFMGKGLAVFRLSQHVWLKAGVWYLDRVQVKILPAGGLVWIPTEDFYCNILFPNPKIAKRLTVWGNTQWWLYADGNYGGGTWTIKRNTGFVPAVPTDGTFTRFDYNDIRVAVGLEFKRPRQLEGYFEVGLACSRELVYQDLSPSSYFPNNTVYIGAGLTY